MFVLKSLLLLGGCSQLALSAFNRIASFPICQQLDVTCNTDEETVAEIVAASSDGMLLIYANGAQKGVGFVDIADPAKPAAAGHLDCGGEVTSVAVTHGNYALAAVNTAANYTHTSGVLKVIDLTTKSVVHSMDLGGQPDAVAVSPDKKYAAIAIENERDEDLGDGVPPQMPAGFLVIIDTSSSDPSAWTSSKVTLTGLTGVNIPEDPEPEFVSINSDNVAVVTLQENNAILLVNLVTGTVTSSFTAGTVDLDRIDTQEEGIIDPSASLSSVPREPDGVTWISTSHFATADEGDMDGGSRGFTIFDTSGAVVYSSGNTMEHAAIRLGHYPDERSGNKGNEPENVVYGEFGDDKLLFVNSERSSLIFVYDVSNPASPKHLQTLPAAGVGPEGGLAIPSRNLLVVASEKDDRGDKMRSAIAVYQYSQAPAQYPSLMSEDRTDGTPIPWSALSGLVADVADSSILYSIEDSFYKKNRIFKIDTMQFPARIVKEIRIKDTNGVFSSFAPYGEFSADDLAAMINDDKTVNIDPEGIAMTSQGFVVASEGRGTVGDSSRPVESLNFLFIVDFEGVITNVVTLPNNVNDIQLRFGFEGVAAQGDYLIVAMQRAWGDEANPRLGIYNTLEQTWKFVYYPLDAPKSQNGGWVGLSDITALGDGEFLVLERDNQGGPDAAIKKIYSIDLGTDLGSVKDGATISKREFFDLMPTLSSTGGLVYEKVEGLAVSRDGTVWIVNDNDGVDDNSGETQLLSLGAIATPNLTPLTCGDIKDAYKASGCCGFPAKTFSFSRRLSVENIEDAVESALRSAQSDTERQDLAIRLQRRLQRHLK
eukprot:TRINITY_DN4318_c0_g1_i4.p1 TRINITY_DN4318_c0_g1~~TRINITY_DN4318_c0_g1_i4.p1  ORF type:complete len:824 (-),score=197.58 TRINITY_DN4318_c0_g1_i4:319-2790(-)